MNETPVTYRACDQRHLEVDRQIATLKENCERQGIDMHERYKDLKSKLDRWTVLLVSTLLSTIVTLAVVIARGIK